MPKRQTVIGWGLGRLRLVVGEDGAGHGQAELDASGQGVVDICETSSYDFSDAHSVIGHACGLL